VDEADGPALAASADARHGGAEREPPASLVSGDAECEHTFVSSEGSPYARFKRALRTGNLALVRAAAGELPAVRLDDALLIAYLIKEQDFEQFERAAVRWLGRFALERPSVRIEDLREAAVAFEALASNPDGARRALAALCARHGLRVAL
jgi:hypothetical protein